MMLHVALSMFLLWSSHDAVFSSKHALPMMPSVALGDRGRVLIFGVCYSWVAAIFTYIWGN